MSDPHEGTLIAGRYRIAHTIGRGSFGRTFRATDTTVDRAVAVKVLDRSASVDLKTLELFEREAAVLRSMRHQGIPEVFDVVRDTWDGTTASFLIMEYVEGTSIAEMIERQQPLDGSEVVPLLLEMLGILEYLHNRVPPIVHRDIKPSNIIVRPDGRPALVDFGSVRNVYLGADEAGSTIAGTYGYMPYEQYMGQATPASDLYSLAATLLHLLTGRPPRAFMTDEGRIAVPDTLPGDPRLQPLIARLLRPSPNERFASARAVRNALLSPDAMPARLELVAPARGTLSSVDLGPAPRAIDGALHDHFRKVAPSAWELMDSMAKPGDGTGWFDLAAITFFSLMTVGILPVTYMSLAAARRRRVRRFFHEGQPGIAEIISIADEKLPFEGKISKVTYQFSVDGVLHRDADQVLPPIANRWQPGDRIQILYVPELDYDSIIVSVR